MAIGRSAFCFLLRLPLAASQISRGLIIKEAKHIHTHTYRGKQKDTLPHTHSPPKKLMGIIGIKKERPRSTKALPQLGFAFQISPSFRHSGIGTLIFYFSDRLPDHLN